MPVAVDGRSPLRVLMIMTSMDCGGMETFTMNIYRAIDRSKVQFDFLLHRPHHGDYEDEIERLGGKIFRIGRQNPLDYGYWRGLDLFFKDHAYPIVHAQLDCMSGIPLLVAKRHGINVRIAHSHSSRQDIDIKYPIKLACKKMIKHVATDLFACGVVAGRWMFETDCYSVIPNAIDTSLYRFDVSRRALMRKRLGISEEACVIGHVGRFAAVKNHSRIISIFQRYHSVNPDSVLLLIGDGELRSEVQAMVDSLCLDDSVRFLGLRSDVPDLMQAMDLLLMPSVYEGLPMSLVEAQASGLTCVISQSIPEDCDIVEGAIRRVSLEEDDAVWASVIMEMTKLPRDRTDWSQLVKNAGFDIKASAIKLQNFYLDEYDCLCKG